MPLPSLQAFEAQMAGLNIPPGDPRYAAMKQRWMEQATDQMSLGELGQAAKAGMLDQGTLRNALMARREGPQNAFAGSGEARTPTPPAGGAPSNVWDNLADPSAIPAAQAMAAPQIDDTSMVQALPDRPRGDRKGGQRDALAWMQKPEAANRVLFNLAGKAEFEMPSQRVKKEKGRFIPFLDMPQTFQEEVVREAGGLENAPTGWWSRDLGKREKQLVSYLQESAKREAVDQKLAVLRAKASPSGSAAQFQAREKALAAQNAAPTQAEKQRQAAILAGIPDSEPR